MLGPGKYDELCTEVRTRSGAAGAIVIIFGGERGDGFSVQTTTPELVVALPGMLRQLADLIEEDLPGCFATFNV